jgi:hypothetical protein
MDNPFAKLDAFILGSILGRCDVADIARMKCTDRALAHLLKVQAVQNNISYCSQENIEEGYSLIIFNEQRADEITARKARAREIHVLKANNEVVTLENDGRRKRVLLYKGFRPILNIGEFWHKNSKLPSNGSLVLCLTRTNKSLVLCLVGEPDAQKAMVTNSNQLQWKWMEHQKCVLSTSFSKFILVIDGHRGGTFVKITSSLKKLPLRLGAARLMSRQLLNFVGAEVFSMTGNKWDLHASLSGYGIPHVGFELRHVFQWNNGGRIYMAFVRDRDIGQLDLGCRLIEDLPPHQLDFRVFVFTIRSIAAGGPEEEGSIEDDRIYNGLTISNWFTSFLLPHIYARPTGARFDNVELQVSAFHNHLFVVRREKYEGWILVELWLKREIKWGRSLRLIPSRPDSAGNTQSIVSFCLWQMNTQYFGMDCILIVGKLHGVDEGSWWIVKTKEGAAVVVSEGMLQDITDGTRFSLVRHFHQK